MRTGHIIISDLTKSFLEGGATRKVLRGVDYSIEKGAFVVLLGRSGAGKSTLLNILSGIETPDSGSVTVGGAQLSSMSEHERTLFRRRKIGFVFQSYNLIPTLTVLENVLLPIQLDARKDGEDAALNLLEEVGLADRIDSFPDVLSGGEQQRVAIARALVNNPMILLADEPTGNLDYETGRQVMDLLHALTKRHGTTMIVVTHDRDFLEASDEIIRLKDGRLTPVSFNEAVQR